MTAVPNCSCKHKAPPLGTNTTCPYATPFTCGGPTYCGFCRANAPKTSPAPLEPDSIAGWVSGPDGIYEVATSGDQPIPTIPREATPMRRPIERALYAVAQTLADALQSKDWRQAEAALEEWRMFRADLERHVDGDERDLRELVAWVAEMSRGEPRIEFAPEFAARLVDLVEKLVREGVTDEDGFNPWQLKTGPEKSAWVQSLADRCARAARVTGWREREQS